MEFLTKENILTIAVFLLGASALWGFFRTKKDGFGRYTASALIIILVLTITAIFFSQGKIDEKLISNILFAVVGFAGGLVTSSKGSSGE